MNNAFEDRDRAVLARVGGNEYRRMIVLGRARGDLLDKYVREDALSLAAGESYLRYQYHDVWSWTDTEGGTHLNPATVSGPDYYASRRPSMVATLPEAAFDWPIYRAATLVRAITDLTGDTTMTYGMDSQPVWIKAQDIGNALHLWPEADDD